MRGVTRITFVALIVVTFVLIALTVALSVKAIWLHSTGLALVGLVDAVFAVICALCALWIVKETER